MYVPGMFMYFASSTYFRNPISERWFFGLLTSIVFSMLIRVVMMMGSSELGFTFESTSGWTKHFSEVYPFFDACCRHRATMYFFF